MDVAIAVAFSLLMVGGVYLTVFLIGTLSHHEEEEEG
jgi:hypothetical protein